MDIIIDTTGDIDLANKSQLLESDNDDDVEIENIGIDPAKIHNADFLTIEKERNYQLKKKKYNSNIDTELDQFEIDMGWRSMKPQINLSDDIGRLINEVNSLDKILEKSVIKPGFEKLHYVPPYELTKKQLKIRKQREKKKAGAGAEWFNMRTPYVTPEIKHDLELLRMRSALNPKHFYKKNDMKALPKHFQVGKIMDSSLDFYSSRLTKKERKNTVVDELMADAEFMKYNKRKYKEIIEEKQKSHYKTHKRAKKLKKKK